MLLSVMKLLKTWRNIFPAFFDKIIVDAPCSGERGCLEKMMLPLKNGHPKNVALCAQRQRSILSQAQNMLKPDGVIVYSTCTFAPAENEEILVWFSGNTLIFVLKTITIFLKLIFQTEILTLFQKNLNH